MTNYTGFYWSSLQSHINVHKRSLARAEDALGKLSDTTTAYAHEIKSLIALHTELLHVLQEAEKTNRFMRPE
jgi:hypothetical protein